ncbi:hypothetical protein ACLESD_19385 [Pyxidicoccus sp. 3LFB2]
MKVLNDFAPIPMPAREAAHPFLAPRASEPVRYALHLPSAQELLGEVLKRPGDFVTKGEPEASGVFVVDHGDKVVSVERDPYSGLIERREFPSLQHCFEALLPLYRRFLKAEFDFFTANLLWDESLFPRQWRYTTELTLGILQKSLRSPDAFHSAPTRTYPPLAEVIALLLPHEARLLDDRQSDGPHLSRTKKGYVFRWYERGQLHGEEAYRTFEEALRKFLEGFMLPDLLQPRPRFSRLTPLEHSWSEGEPPV